MENLDKTLDSGAVLSVTLAPFEVGHKLLKVVTREIETIKFSLGGVDIDVDKLKEIFSSDDAMNTIKNIIMRSISSDGIDEVLWQCMAYATYNKVKIIKENNVFESLKSRGDYLVVAKEVLWFNLSPFFSNLSSMLPASLRKSTALPNTP